METINVTISNSGKEVQLSLPAMERVLCSKIKTISQEEDETKFTVKKIMPEGLSFLEGKIVDLDELNFLAKYVDSLYAEEPQKLYVAADHEKVTTVKELINLAFSLDRYTLIQNIGKLEDVGRKHYLTTHGCIAKSEEEKVDFAKIGKDLLQSGKGIVTRCGILFKNDEKAMEEVYDGRVFPAYWFNGNTRYTVSLKYEGRKEYVYMPCEEMAITKAFKRLGVDDPNMCAFETEQSDLSDYWEDKFKEYLKEKEPYKMNQLLSAMTNNSLTIDKFTAMMMCAHTDSLNSALTLVERIREFEFIRFVDSYEEVGRYVIDNSNEYELSEDLEDFFNFSAFGEYFADENNGEFVDGGFLYGDKSVEEILQHLCGLKKGGI